ncbi:DMT family transporter [Fulvivirga lutimaris]|uniref:DMT family transporter n=1 Tax=Fulvivirga lutimaris TaxID=1819566 RepID=UPI002483658E|nr:DMT family transporter [Fulvivirga lutimaris]
MITKGLKFMILATFLFALMNVFVKMIPNIPAVQVVLFRSVVSLVLSAAFLKGQRVNLWGNNKKLLLLRGAFGSVGLILYFYTLQAMPLASAVTIQFLAPIFATILGIFIVKEKVKPLQWFFFLLAFTGVVLVKGFDPRITPWLFLVGIISALFSGLAYNVIRKLKLTEHPLVIVFYFPLVTIPFAGVWSYFNWVVPTPIEWGILLIVGVLTQLAQYFMTKAYQEEELSKVSSLQYIGIIYALGFGFVLFDELFNVMSYVGMAIMLIGVFANVWYKNRIARV